MTYQVTRLMTYMYASAEDALRDMENWEVPATGVRQFGQTTVRSAVIGPVPAPEEPEAEAAADPAVQGRKVNPLQLTEGRRYRFEYRVTDSRWAGVGDFAGNIGEGMGGEGLRFRGRDDNGGEWRLAVPLSHVIGVYESRATNTKKPEAF